MPQGITFEMGTISILILDGPRMCVGLPLVPSPVALPKFGSNPHPLPMHGSWSFLWCQTPIIDIQRRHLVENYMPPNDCNIGPPSWLYKCYGICGGCNIKVSIHVNFDFLSQIELQLMASIWKMFVSPTPIKCMRKALEFQLWGVLCKFGV